MCCHFTTAVAQISYQLIDTCDTLQKRVHQGATRYCGHISCAIPLHQHKAQLFRCIVHLRTPPTRNPQCLNTELRRNAKTIRGYTSIAMLSDRSFRPLSGAPMPPAASASFWLCGLSLLIRSFTLRLCTFVSSWSAKAIAVWK